MLLLMIPERIIGKLRITVIQYDWSHSIQERKLSQELGRVKK